MAVTPGFSEIPVILILGPTAGGKTRLAIDLANSLPGGGECICADSMQVYRGMDIGTAKPTADEQAQAPHHLIDIADPADDSFNVDTWLKLANEKIATVREKGKYPIIVGGTNLYIQAFLEGLFEGPEPDLELRSRLQAMEPDELRSWLQRVDPTAAERIHRNDRKRTIRAIEVHELTGERLSDLQQQWEGGNTRKDVILIGLDYPAEDINRRINARVKIMLEQGLVEEIQALHDAGKLGLQSAEALGYKQIIEVLEGRWKLDEAVEQIKIRTRRYAKQQRTWLRKFRSHPGSTWIAASGISSEDIVDNALRAIAEIEKDSGMTSKKAK